MTGIWPPRANPAEPLVDGKTTFERGGDSCPFRAWNVECELCPAEPHECVDFHESEINVKPRCLFTTRGWIHTAECDERNR